MTIHRFFIAPQYIDEEQGTIGYRSQKLVKQIHKVLRLENGDKIAVLDGRGNIYHCILQSVRLEKGQDFFQAKIISKEKNIESTGINFTVAMPLIKTSRFEWALEKMTELGVDKIIPVTLSRTVIKTEQTSKLTRWCKIIEEAAEQCERLKTPELIAPLQFCDWLAQYEQVQDNYLRLICIERQATQSLEEALCNFIKNQTNTAMSCAIAIGAEGGFSEEEMEAAFRQNFIPVSLGTNILRSETAAIYALSISTSLLARRAAGGIR